MRDAVNVFMRDHVDSADPATSKRPGNRLVVTSRIAGYNLCPLSGNAFTVVVEGMTPSAVDQFVGNWMRAMHETPDEAEERVSVLLEQLRDPQRKLQSFVSNPLQAGVLTAVFHQNHTLADTRVENYSLAVSKFFDRWLDRSGKENVDHAVDEQSLTECLEDVALWIHENRSTGLILRTELEQLLLDSLRNRKDADEQELKRAVQLMVETLSTDIGMLAPRGQDHFGFLVLSLQEYLVARRMTRGGLDDVCRTLQKYLDDARFREPILMALGHMSQQRPEDLQSLFQLFLASDENFRDLLPRPPLTVLAALDDLIEHPDQQSHSGVISQIIERLVDSYAADQATSELREIVVKAFEKLRTIDEMATTRSLSTLLDMARQRNSQRRASRAGCAVAMMLVALDWFPKSVMRQLVQMLDVDSESLGWPIQTAVHRALSGLPGSGPSQTSNTFTTPERAPTEIAVPGSPLAPSCGVHSFNRIVADQQWLRLLIGLFGCIEDWGAKDRIEEYQNLASYLQLPDGYRDRYTPLFHRQWGADNTIYEIAVYLDSKCGNYWKLRKRFQPFAPGIKIEANAIEDGLLHAIGEGLDVSHVADELRSVLQTDPDPALKTSATVALSFLEHHERTHTVDIRRNPDVRAALSRSKSRIRDATSRAAAFLASRTFDPEEMPEILTAYLAAVLNSISPATGVATALGPLAPSESLVSVFRGIGEYEVNENQVKDQLESLEELPAQQLISCLLRVPDTISIDVDKAPIQWVVRRFLPTSTSDELPFSVIDIVLSLPDELGRFRSSLWNLLLPLVGRNPICRSEFLAALLCDFSVNSDSTDIWHKLAPTSLSEVERREYVEREAGSLESSLHRCRARIRLADAWGRRRSTLLTLAHSDARSIEPGLQRTEMLEQLAARFPVQDREEIVEELISSVHQIEESEQRCRAWLRVLFLVSHEERADVIRAALADAERIADESQRSALLAKCRGMVAVFPECDHDWTRCLDSFDSHIERANAEGMKAPIVDHCCRARNEVDAAEATAWATLYVAATLQDLGVGTDCVDDLWIQLSHEPSPELVMQLVELGEERGLQLSSAGVLALDRCLADGCESLLEPLWPLLQGAGTQAAPILDQWMLRRTEVSKGLFGTRPRESDGRSGLAEYAALLLCELENMPVEGTFRRLATMLGSDDASTRQRVDRLLCSDFRGNSPPPRFSAAILSDQWMRELIETILHCSDGKVRLPFVVLAEQIQFNDVDYVTLLIAEQTNRQSWQSEILSLIEDATEDVQLALVGLVETADRPSGRAIVSGLAMLAARGRLIVDEALLRERLPPAAEHFDDFVFHLDVPNSDHWLSVIQETLFEACGDPDVASDALPEPVIDSIQSRMISLGDLLQDPTPEISISDALSMLGHSLLFKQQSSDYLESAKLFGEEIIDNPFALEILLKWFYSHRSAATSNTQKTGLSRASNAGLRDLILLGLAGTALAAPNRFLQAVGDPGVLRSAVISELQSGHRGRIGRCAGLTLLGMLRLATAEVAQVFQNAFGDSPDVIDGALSATERFREIEPGALDHLTGSPDTQSGMYSGDVVAAYASARILRTVGASPWASASVRRRILSEFAAATRHPLAARRIHLGPPLPNLPPPPRLSEEFHAALVAVARMDEPN